MTTKVVEENCCARLILVRWVWGRAGGGRLLSGMPIVLILLLVAGVVCQRDSIVIVALACFVLVFAYSFSLQSQNSTAWMASTRLLTVSSSPSRHGLTWADMGCGCCSLTTATEPALSPCFFVIYVITLDNTQRPLTRLLQAAVPRGASTC